MKKIRVIATLVFLTGLAHLLLNIFAPQTVFIIGKGLSAQIASWALALCPMGISATLFFAGKQVKSLFSSQ